MALAMDTKNRRYETVRSIKVEIGDEKVSHDFGRAVSMQHARKWAQHYLDVFTGEPSSFVNVEQPS